LRSAIGCGLSILAELSKLKGEAFSVLLEDRGHELCQIQHRRLVAKLYLTFALTKLGGLFRATECYKLLFANSFVNTLTMRGRVQSIR